MVWIPSNANAPRVLTRRDTCSFAENPTKPERSSRKKSRVRVLQTLEPTSRTFTFGTFVTCERAKPSACIADDVVASTHCSTRRRGDRERQREQRAACDERRIVARVHERVEVEQGAVFAAIQTQPRMPVPRAAPVRRSSAECARAPVVRAQGVVAAPRSPLTVRLAQPCTPFAPRLDLLPRCAARGAPGGRRTESRARHTWGVFSNDLGRVKKLF